MLGGIELMEESLAHANKMVVTAKALSNNLLLEARGRPRGRLQYF